MHYSRKPLEERWTPEMSKESSRYRELILGTLPATRRCWHTLNSSGHYLPLSSTSNLVSSLSMMLFYDSFSATVTSPVLFAPPSCHLNFYWRYFYYRLRNWPASLQNPLSHTPNPHLMDTVGTNLSIVAQRPFGVNGNVSLPFSFEHYGFGQSILASEAADWKLLCQILIVLWTSHINLCEKSRLKLTCISWIRLPSCVSPLHVCTARSPLVDSSPSNFAQCLESISWRKVANHPGIAAMQLLNIRNELF
jgi:hypothetical protein